jgi:hypothetical protein
MTVTAPRTAPLHNDRVMARRSSGVVLIVALLGWTVNRPHMECESQHSRAAVVVQAGASPAYQPEPSPTRHSCCPRESHQPEAQSTTDFPACHHQFASNASCCSVKKDGQQGLPPTVVREPSSAKFALSSFFLGEHVAPKVELSVATSFTDSSGITQSSSSVLRL